MTTLDPHAPVLVGVGTVEQREDDPSLALEPLALMVEAAHRAAADTGAPDVLRRVDVISVPRGRWRYQDPGRCLAHHVGAPAARTVLAQVGILQQTLIGDACARIADGEADVVLVVGGEAGHRRRRAELLGVAAPEREAPGTPSESWRPDREMVLPVELAAGLGGMPVGYYALIESAIAHQRGVGIDAHRDEIAERYARFSEIAAANPHAWRRHPLAASDIRDPSAENRMLAFPYTKRLVTTWSVDQAAALILCSTRVADEHGIPASRRIHPLVSSESNHMTAVSERRDLTACPGAKLAGEAALAHAGLEVDEIDFIELYSCFPAAVQTCAAALDLAPDRDLTVTGGMPFAGGPFNNYVLQATCRVAELLRCRTTATALVSCVSGLLTKQGFGIWSTDPGSEPFAMIDVTNHVASTSGVVTVRPVSDSAGTIVATTVMHPSDGPTRAVAVIDLPDGTRTLASSTSAELIAALEREDQCGRSALVSDGSLGDVHPSCS